MLGLVAGIGLEAKYTIGVLLVAFTIGLLADAVEARCWRRAGPGSRSASRSSSSCRTSSGRRSTAGRASTSPRARTRRPPRTPRGPPTSSRGCSSSASPAPWSRWSGSSGSGGGRGLRPLAIVPVVVTLLFLVERGRSYYPLPGDTIAFAAGIVALGGWLRAGSRVRWAAVGALAARPARGAGRGGAARPAGALDRLDGPRRDLEGHVLQGRARLAGARRPDGAGVARAARRRPARRRRPRRELRRGLGARALRPRARAAARPQRPPLVAVLAPEAAALSGSPSSSATTPASSSGICSVVADARRRSTTAGTSPTRSGGGRSPRAHCGARSASSGSRYVARNIL